MAAGVSPVRRWTVASVVSASVVLTHTAFFTLAGAVDVPFPPASASVAEQWAGRLRALYRFELWASTAGGLREREAVIAAYRDAIRRDFDPADTVLVTELGNPRSYPWFRHLMYYLPEFSVYHLRLDGPVPGYLVAQAIETVAAVEDAEVLLPTSTRRVVWVVDSWDPTLPRPAGLEAHPVGQGRWVYVLDLRGWGRRAVRHAGYRLTPVTAVARLR